MLYHSDTPVLSVERGTTFGLIKMLYESVGGHGQIIGLRQRENSSGLVCIITQDPTILTEREYDIILHGKWWLGCTQVKCRKKFKLCKLNIIFPISLADLT